MNFFQTFKKKFFAKNKINDSQDKRKSKAQQKKQDKKDLQRNLLKKHEKNQIKRQYDLGLKKSRFSFVQKIRAIQAKFKKIDEELFQELEAALIMSDISVRLVEKLLESIKQEVKIRKIEDPKAIKELLVNQMFSIYDKKELSKNSLQWLRDVKLNVILLVGVNGGGKTTTVAKLAHKLKLNHKKVLLAAADTFRAGAVEQLKVWAQKINVDVVEPLKMNDDPASVVFRALDKAQQENYDVLIIDTSGRLENKTNLMKELIKINQIIQRKITNAPHETLLVMDATMGQNGLSQAENFKKSIPLTGIVLTKLDGASKGGILFTIRVETGLVVKFVGLGENLEDLHKFNLNNFIYGLTKELFLAKF